MGAPRDLPSIDCLFVRPFAHGFLEGSPDAIRHLTLSRLPGLAQSVAGSHAPVWIDDCPEEIHDLYIVVAGLKSYLFNDPDYDMAVLTLVTFTRDFPERPLEAIEDALTRVDWDRHARRTTID